jgi:hypothetical protein
MDYEYFKKDYLNNQFDKIDMTLNINQRYFIWASLEENLILNYLEVVDKFKKLFKNIQIKFNEDTFKNIKYKLYGGTNNYSIEELCDSLKLINNNIIVEKYPIKIDYKNSKNEVKERNQTIIP